MIIFIRNIFLAFFLFGAGIASYSQYFDFSFEHLTTEDGLSNDVVNAIVQDKTGFMWFGTNDGLNRYDGRNFRIIKAVKNDSAGLPSSFIAHMNVDKDGWLWLSTGKGLCKFNPEKFQFILPAFPGNDGKQNTPSSNVAFTPDDYAWFINGGHLYKMHRRLLTYKRFSLPSADAYYSISIDKKGRIWTYLRNALYRFIETSGEFKYYGGMNNLHPEEKLLFGPPVQMAGDSLVMTSYGSGFFYYDEKNDRFIRWKNAAHLVTQAVEDFDENGHRFFWCLGGAGGLMVYDPLTDRFHGMMNNPRDPYSHNATDCPTILKDTNSGTVWIATKSGIEKYDPHSLRFKRKFLPSSIPYNSFSLLGEVIQDKTDPSGKTYWIGSWALGLFKWNRQTNEFKNFNMQDGLLHHEVFHVTQSKFGYLIIGCMDGVQLFDPRSERPIRQIKNFFKWPISKKILYVSEDHLGNIWMVANYDGVYQFDIKTGTVKHWEIPGVVPEKGPYLSASVQEDQFNRMWVTGFTGKIHIIDPASGEIKTIGNENRKGTKLSGDATTLYINNKTKEIWVSGFGNYLARLNENGEVLKMFIEKRAETGAGYNILVQDSSGYMWANAGNYIQRINTKTGVRDYFEKEDGLVSSSGIFGATITDDGELFLGFQYSFCHINTNRIPFNTRAPSVAISDVKVNYQSRHLMAGEELVLQPNDKVVTIEFAALNFSQPRWNQFAYRLDGYYNEWFYGNDHDITLMNLESGKHFLHVKAGNNDGVWGKEMIIPIRVIPPFYKTLWFRTLIGVAIGLLIYLFYWHRKEQQKKLAKIRDRIATDLHDDMGSTLSSIRIFSDVAKKQIEEKPETVQLLDRIGNNATSLSENMQDIIWTIRNDNDTLDDLVSRMREFGLRVCDAKNIRFNVQVSQNFKTSRINLEQRRNLYLIFKETINNAVKYAEASIISLFLTQQGRYLKMEIADNGKGFEINKIKKGNGLNNLEKRAKEINGEISIHSVPGKGTRINLMVILKKSSLGETKI